MDFYAFYTGKSFTDYEFLGAHFCEGGAVFRVYAPNAKGVVLIINGYHIEMKRIYDGNFYEAFALGAREGDKYEYRVYVGDGYTDRCDPYGFYMEAPPEHKSVLYDVYSYRFRDKKWLSSRTDKVGEPLNIYEMHLGSWRKKGEEFYSYAEIAPLLIPYLKENGYNYVEFMPLAEHPCLESWGYQITGYYAPTARYGSPRELMYLVDELHLNGIGVILDFVPVHFAVDGYALNHFDGSALYEYPSGDVGISEWGSCNFMHSRGEVRSFLQSNANFWLGAYHVDGLRMDAVSRIIYWNGDERRGVNNTAVDFLKVMNRGLKERNAGCMLIAEDSSVYAGVTKKVEDGGLGFDYKWDLGWMHDTLDFFRTGVKYRTGNYNKLTFRMMYFYNEKYLLPLSHDEVVHGKATILQKMNGDYADKFPQARSLYMYMAVCPGKKLNFMGGEIGHFREWDERREQDWNLLSYPAHDAFFRYVRELNNLYLSHSALWQKDYSRDGFKWLDCDSADFVCYAILRESDEERIIAVFNLLDRAKDYSFTFLGGDYSVLLYTDWKKFGGGTPDEEARFSFKDARASFSLAAYSGMLLSEKKR